MVAPRDLETNAADLRDARACGFSVRALDALPTAIVILDRDARILVANEHAGALLGRGPMALTGRLLGDLLDGVADLSYRATHPDAERHGEATLEHPSGQRRIFSYTVGSVEESARRGNDWCYSIVFQDITEVARLRRERDRLLKLATVGEVMPTILHELRNPIAAITTSVEVAMEDMNPGPLQELLYAVLTEARRIDVSLQGLGAAERRLRSERHEPVDHAVREAARIVSGRAAKAGITVLVDVPSMPLLRFDPAAVRAVVFNLMNNSLQFSSPGDTLSVGARLVQGEQGQLFELWVQDTGSGMDEETLAHCTELFFSTRHSGSGIGLSLCKKVTEEAGGRFRVESRLGEGTRVELSLPLKE